MTKGVLLFAQNNPSIDYVKQSIFCAKKIKKHLKLPVALATDNIDYLKTAFPFYSSYIDTVIELDYEQNDQKRKFYDGTMSNRTLSWKNQQRSNCYFLTPYDETIVMDTDVVICNNQLLHSFDYNQDFLLYKISKDINSERTDPRQFERISDRSIDMFWATVFYFKKTEFTKFFFDLVSHVKENWHYYRLIYQIPQKNYRNDFSFSIAIHILNGFQKSDWPKSLPGNLWYSTDRDVCINMDREKFTFLLDKKDWPGHYTVGSIKDANIHIMNKFSLNRLVDKEFENE